MAGFTIPWGTQPAQKNSQAPPTVTSTWILQRAPVLTPDELQEAEYRHGGPSDFDFSTTNPRDTKDGTTVVFRPGGDDNEERAPQGLLLEFRENRPSRRTHNVIIKAEGDSDASVTVQRIDQIDFIGGPSVIDLVSKAMGVKYDAVIRRDVIVWNEGE